MNHTEYKTLGCPEPPDKPRSTIQQKNLIVRIKRFIILKLRKK